MEEIVELLVVRAAPHKQQQLRQTLSTYSAEELALVKQAIISRAMHKVAEDEREDELIRINAEIAAERELFRLYREPQRKAEAAQQEKKDRTTFTDAARTLRSFGTTDANFNLIRQTLGSGFSIYQIQQMLIANGAILSGPTQQELDEWERQAIKAHNQHLLNMDIPSLRKLAREAGARGQAAPPPDETQRVRQAEEKFYGTGYPVLPDELRIGDRDELIDAAYIKRCSKETLRLLMKRYGADQVNEALRTRSPQTSPLW
jgi:hypothetical protein